ncbi:MAG: hypothetical protein RRC07_02610 [Anaerolineae bacterium]|nr:hypothetical protein [Anaerolineae bacterium]
MTRLPVTRMTLYKHGVGYFERGGAISGDELTLKFHETQMNDLLKSLTVIDRGKGQVLGVDYPTPQSREERLAGNSIRLRQGSSLRDLLASLRGRRVTLALDQDERYDGRVLGIDEIAEQPLAAAQVSLLDAAREEVLTFPLGRVQGVYLRDEDAARDLRFFLDTAMAQEDYREVAIRLSPGEHDLLVAYVAPAPTWRVSYRLVTAGSAGSEALLLGWGIFDNQLEEALENIELTLVAGMPISFIYDLHTPFTPERPEVEEEARVAAGPVAFEAPVEKAMRMEAAPAAMSGQRSRMAAAAFREDQRDALREAAPVTTSGEARGEQFQYRIGTPVNVGRGQSAMVPIIAADLPGRRELLYNSSQLASHPVATLRLRNNSGLTFERGPVTVIAGDGYAGEAILPYTAEGAELFVPYAVELNVQVREHQQHRSEIRALHIEGAYFIVEQWEIRDRDYFVVNKTAVEQTILIEHPRSPDFELFDTPDPAETTAEQLRFSLAVPARQERRLRVQQRQLISRREHLERQTYEQLSRYLRQGLLDQEQFEAVLALLRLYERVAEVQRNIERTESRRQKLFQSQEQIRHNLQALGQSGKEGALRTSYVNRLERSEQQLELLQAEEDSARELLANLNQEVEAALAALS